MLINTEFIIYSDYYTLSYKIACFLLDGHVTELFVEISEILIDQVFKLLAVNHVNLTAHFNHLIAALLEVVIIIILKLRSIHFGSESPLS